MDQSKLQAAAGSSLQAGGKAASGVATPAARTDSSAWKKQRPGATFFEKLQVSMLYLCILLYLYVFVRAMLYFMLLQEACVVMSPTLSLTWVDFQTSAWRSQKGAALCLPWPSCGRPNLCSFVTLSQFGPVVAKCLCCHATRQLLSATAMAMKHINLQLVIDVFTDIKDWLTQLVSSSETTFAAMVCFA